MRALIFLAGLAAVPAVFGADASPFDRTASVLPPGIFLPAAPRPVAGVPVEPRFWIERAEPAQAAGPETPAPLAAVDLRPLLNRNWIAAESIGEGADKLFLSGQVDLEGNPYLAVLSPSWESPRFFAIKRGMSGSWAVNNANYKVSLNVSIFRKKLNNYIVIEKDGSGKVYEKRIGEFFAATGKAGQDVAVGGQTYRLFYSNMVDKTKDPMVMDPNSFGFCFVHDRVNGSDHDFKFYLIARKDIVGKEPASYKLFDDQVFRFRVTDDLSTLEISR